MSKNSTKRLTITLDDYIIKIAEAKAKIMFKGNMDNYINWLICSNNKQDVRKAVKIIEADKEKKKPIAVPETLKTAMFNNVCDYCNQPIYQGDEICKAEDYENYIHKRCCRRIEEISI